MDLLGNWIPSAVLSTEQLATNLAAALAKCEQLNRAGQRVEEDEDEPSVSHNIPGWVVHVPGGGG